MTQIGLAKIGLAKVGPFLSRCRLRGSRVGEASNPGPPHLRRLQSITEQDWPVSSFLGWGALGSRQHGPGCVAQSWWRGSIVSPTDSLAPNMDAIQQTFVDTDSEDGRPLLQLEPQPVDVISALSETSLWIRVQQSEDPGTRSIQKLHWSHNLHRALPGPFKIGNHCARQCSLSNSRPEVHVMSQGADEAGSTAFDTKSLAWEPRIRRLRLSLVWDVGSNPPSQLIRRVRARQS